VGTSLHSFLISIPIAFVLWALMLLAVAVAVVLMAQPRGSAAPAPTRSRSGSERSDHTRSGGERSGGERSGRSRLGGLGFGLARFGRLATPPGRAAGWDVDSSVTADLRLREPDAPGGRLSAGLIGDAGGVGSVADDLRFADEVTVAAERAAATSARARAGWEAAQRELDAAWADYEEADAAARRIWAATSFPLMSRRRTLGENADRERYLHHAATVACRQRELSIAQLNDVLAHRGWNPRLHPAVQEALLRNAIREHKFAAYQAAQRRERAAWQEAETAAEALRALRVEAASAFGRSVTEQRVVNEFWWAEPWTTSELPVAA